MKNDNGGSAFPVNDSTYLSAGEFGMTLRDYFAAKAMVGMFADSDFATHDAGEVILAKVAYKMADAMIAERAK